MTQDPEGCQQVWLLLRCLDPGLRVCERRRSERYCKALHRQVQRGRAATRPHSAPNGTNPSDEVLTQLKFVRTISPPCAHHYLSRLPDTLQPEQRDPNLRNGLLFNLSRRGSLRWDVKQCYSINRTHKPTSLSLFQPILVPCTCLPSTLAPAVCVACSIYLKDSTPTCRKA